MMSLGGAAVELQLVVLSLGAWTMPSMGARIVSIRALTMASTLVVASIARSGAQPKATTSPTPSATLRKRLAITALMKRLVAEGAFSTAASSAPGEKLRSKMAWTDRAPGDRCCAFVPSSRGLPAALVIPLPAVEIGLAVAIEAPAAGRDPSAYFRLEDGIQTTLSWGEGMKMRRLASGAGSQMLSRPLEPRLLFAVRPLKE